MKEDIQMKPKVAVLITGTYREVEFLLQLFPYMAGSAEYDIFLVLRHVRTDEVSRLGTPEQDFEISRLKPFLNERHFLCELPSIDSDFVASKYLIPVGPMDKERERGMLSMSYGVFTGISMIKSSMRRYTHIMRTRTDYLPWIAPWVSGMLELYEHSGRRIIVDGVVTKPQRYPDRVDIPWQGSISDLFCFASTEQFLKLWDIEEILPKIWTGISETTVFRAAIARFLGDDLQSLRRNDSFLKKYFSWQPNNTKQSFHMLRARILPDNVKQKIFNLVKNQKLSAVALNKLIRTSYDFIAGSARQSELEQIAVEYLPAEEVKAYILECSAAVAVSRPV